MSMHFFRQCLWRQCSFKSTFQPSKNTQQVEWRSQTFLIRFHLKYKKTYIDLSNLILKYLDMYSMKCHSVSYKTFCTNISKVLQVNDISDNVMIESHDFIYSSGALQWLLVNTEFMRCHVIIIMVTDDRNRKLWNNIHIVKSVDNKYRLHLLAKNRPKIAELRKESCTSILCTSQCNWILCSLALYHHRESLSLSR